MGQNTLGDLWRHLESPGMKFNTAKCLKLDFEKLISQDVDKRMHAGTHARMRACAHARMHTWAHERMHTNTHARMYECTCARLQVWTHVRMHAASTCTCAGTCSIHAKRGRVQSILRRQRLPANHKIAWCDGHVAQKAIRAHSDRFNRWLKR